MSLRGFIVHPVVDIVIVLCGVPQVELPVQGLEGLRKDAFRDGPVSEVERCLFDGRLKLLAESRESGLVGPPALDTEVLLVVGVHALIPGAAFSK